MHCESRGSTEFRKQEPGPELGQSGEITAEMSLTCPTGISQVIKSNDHSRRGHQLVPE